eukprot:GGOE01007168.1.p1 GENE.GGOE01007168.1~~GGOE01007168.1.p1  ORF type:complete len:675 (-),score=197.85 GGOE01007168.1:847-2871(-)
MMPGELTTDVGPKQRRLLQRPLPVLTGVHLGSPLPTRTPHRRMEEFALLSARSCSSRGTESDQEDSPGHNHLPSPSDTQCKAQLFSDLLDQCCALAEDVDVLSEADRQRLVKLCGLLGHTAVPGWDRKRTPSLPLERTGSAASVAAQVPLRELQRRMGSPIHVKRAGNPSETLVAFLSSLITRLSDPPALHAHLLAYAPRILDADDVHLLLAGQGDTFWNVATGTIHPAVGILGYVWTSGQAVNLHCGALNLGGEVPDEATGTSAHCVVQVPGHGLLVAVRDGRNSPTTPFHEEEFQLLRMVGKLLGAHHTQQGRPPDTPTFEQVFRSAMDPVRLCHFRPILREQIRRVNDIHVTPEERAALRTMDFNVHFYGDMADAPHRLIRMCVVMLEDLNLFEDLQLERTVMVRFILRVQNLYNKVKYHNFSHAVDVAHMLFVLARQLEEELRLSPLEKLVLLVSALLHDVGHEGLNNAFLRRTGDPLALLATSMGSASVMEVHHCQLAVEILRDPETNAFHSLSAESTVEAHRLMLSLIMHTDMERHREVCEQFRACRKPSRELVLGMLMKSADLSNVAKPFSICRRWAVVVMEEFWAQGDREKEVGLEVLPMFDRAKAGDLVKHQLGFIDRVALNHFEMMADWCPDLQFLADNVRENRQRWQREWEAPPGPNPSPLGL